MSALSSLFPNGRPTGALVASVVAVGVSAVVLTKGLGGVLGAAIAPSVGADEADPLSSVTEDSAEFFATSRKRFEGRSVFSLPQPPVRRPRIPDPPPRPPVEPPKDPPPPAIPTSYTGPAVKGVLGDRVFFDSFAAIVGETRNGVTVISIDGPWKVRLGHKGGEYDVDLLKRPDEKFLRAAGPPSGSLADGMGAGASSGAAAGGLARPGTTPAGISGGTGASRAPARASGSNGTRPAIVGPGDEPGADRPSGPGPEGDGGSPAMRPQRLAPPNGPGGAGAPGSPNADPNADPTTDPASEPSEEPSENGEGEEYVDRSLLPPPLSDERIAAMSVPEARAALDSIDATNAWNVDDHSRARLNWERQRLIDRINRAP
jgi:hypothetical protein